MSCSCLSSTCEHYQTTPHEHVSNVGTLHEVYALIVTTVGEKGLTGIFIWRAYTNCIKYDLFAPSLSIGCVDDECVAAVAIQVVDLKGCAVR